MKALIKNIIISLIFLHSSTIAAIDLYGEEKLTVPEKEIISSEKKFSKKPDSREFRHVIRKDITAGEKLLTLGIVYSVQWSYYLAFQWDTIQEHGSYKNYQNIYRPHFDRDSYNYNMILHTLTGNYYYLFYRSRGHTKVDSLMWSAISQLLFEFTIEVITEPPSFQDIYQTPILGAVMGITLEYLSCKLLSTDYTAAHILGYILNPFALFPFSSYEAAALPQVSYNYLGYAVTFRF